MAKSKAELMAEKMKKERVAQIAFEAGSKPTTEPPAEPELPINESNSPDLDPYHSPCGSQGKKGHKTRRMNLAIQNDVYEYIRRESRKMGMTYSEYICALARHYRDFYPKN